MIYRCLLVGKTNLQELKKGLLEGYLINQSFLTYQRNSAL